MTFVLNRFQDYANNLPVLCVVTLAVNNFYKFISVQGLVVIWWCPQEFVLWQKELWEQERGSTQKPQWITFSFLRYLVESKVSLLKKPLDILTVNTTLKNDPHEPMKPQKPHFAGSLKHASPMKALLFTYSNWDSVNIWNS